MKHTNRYAGGGCVPGVRSADPCRGIRFPKINGEERPQAGRFRFPPTLCAHTGGFADWCLEVFSQRMHLTVGDGDPWLILEKDETLPPEGYCLTVTEQGVRIRAAAEWGVVWALTTVYLRADGGSIGCGLLHDAPRYAHRGQSLDCVRHFFPAETVEGILEQMSLVKLNVLHLHLTDDQGWRLESKRFPRLQAVNGEYYTQEQLRHLVTFARVRGIEIIPEIDLPGHTTALLAAFPELGCTGTAPQIPTQGGIFTTILCGGKGQVYAFLEELLEEVCGIFPSGRIHIGGDEAPKKQWAQCPHCQAALQRLGLADFEQLLGYFTRRVADILKKHGRIPICWNETLKGLDASEEMQMQYWTMDGLEKMNTWAKSGRQYIYSYMCQLYFDYPYSMSGVRKLYKLRPRMWNRRCEADPGLLGLEGTVWAEHIRDSRSLQEHLFPRVYILAELAWSGGHGAYRDFLEQLRRLCALAEKTGICTQPESGWNPKGKLRRQEALDFFIKMNGGVLEDVPQENQAPAPLDLRIMADYVLQFFRLSDLPTLAKIYFR